MLETAIARSTGTIHVPASALSAPLDAVAAVRRRAELAFERTVTIMSEALDDLARSSSTLSSLASALSPTELARLVELQDRFESFSAGLEDKVRCDLDAAARVTQAMDGGHRCLGELRQLNRTGLLVALNARVVSAGIRKDNGALDMLAQDMRQLLLDVATLAEAVTTQYAQAQCELDRVRAAAIALQDFAASQTIPALRDFAALVQLQARNQTLSRLAAFASRRMSTLSDRVGAAMLHLQVGDSLRQRLEHVEAILTSAAAPDGPVPLGTRRALAGAQLRAATDDLDRAVEGGRRSLRALARSAAQVPANVGIGGISVETSTPHLLVASASRIAASVDQLAAMRGQLSEASEALARSVTDVGRLANEAAQFEIRMTVLGLNAILLSSRLGTEGRAMSEVSQQLRDVAHNIAAVVVELRDGTNSVAAATRDLGGREGEGRMAVRFEEVTRATQEVSAMAEVAGRHLEELGTLRTTGAIADMFTTAEGELAAFLAEVQGLDAVAASLKGEGPGDMPLPPGSEEVLAAIRQTYTMAAEREVHDRLFPPAETVLEESAEDIMF